MKITGTRHRSVAAVALATVAALGLAACGDGASDDNGAGTGGNGGGGVVSVDGSSTVFPLAAVAGELFEGDSSHRVTVGTSGTGGGFEKFCQGETDISNASRPIKDEELAACEAAGITPVELITANDALTVVVNSGNDFAGCLTVDELGAIWEPGSEVNNWNQVRSDFPDQSIDLFAPGTDSGTFDYFTEVINGEGGASRTDFTPSEDDNVLVNGIAGTPGALGYFGLTYYEENKDKLNAVAIDGGDGCVEPSTETAQSGEYAPLARPLYIYVSDSAYADKPAVKEFVDYFVENNAQIAGDAQFVPLNDEQVATLDDQHAQLGS